MTRGCPKCGAVTVLTCPRCYNDSTIEQIAGQPASQPQEQIESLLNEVLMASGGPLFAEAKAKLLAAVRAPSGEGRGSLTRDDIAQIIEGIEHFCIGPIENVECRAIWQPYIDKLQALAAPPGSGDGPPQGCCCHDHGGVSHYCLQCPTHGKQPPREDLTT